MRWKSKLSIAHIFIVFVILATYSLSSKAHLRDFIHDVSDFTMDYLDTWNISGTNTMRYEYYNNRGNIAASPFPHEGSHALDEFSVNFNKRISPYERYTGQILGVISGSEYRSDVEHEFILERFNLTHEKGDATIPYRWELGDHGAFFSFRTLQRTLKGALLELQPNWGPANRNYSLLFVTGANQPTWTGYDTFDDYYTGVSWLIHENNEGSISLNVVHNMREKDGATTNDRRQWVTSVAGERQYTFMGQDLTFESELGYLHGDIANEINRNDTTVLVQFRGKNNTPFTYRARFERTGQDYAPAGSVTPVNRRSYEFHWGYRFLSGIFEGLNMRGRVQEFHDAFETRNRSTSKVVGLNLSGQFIPNLVENLSGRLDAFATATHDNDNTVDVTTGTVRLDLSKPLPRGWNGRLSLFNQYVNNEIRDAADTRTKQLSLQGDHAIQVGPFKGNGTIGVTYRKIYRDGQDDKEITPTVSGSLSKDQHSLSFNFSMDDFDRKAAVNLNQKRFSATYRYNANPHTFGVEYEKFHRDPHNEGAAAADILNTNAYKIAVFWTYNFNRPARTTDQSAVVALSSGGADRFDVLNFGPGQLLQTALDSLTPQFGAPNQQFADVFVYEGPIFQEFDQRQRIALVEVGGTIKKSVHIIDFEDVGNLENVEQTYARIRDKLLAIYGPTTDVVERGLFTAGLAGDLANGNFVRNMEWKTEDGVIRFGIPDRDTDATIRMEIQHAKRFPSPNTSNGWSLEEVK